MNDSSWFDEAFCLGEDTDSFFEKDLQPALIQNFCSKCPVRKECLNYGLESQNIFGVWGGVRDGDLQKALGLDVYCRTTGLDPVCPKCHNKTVHVYAKTRTTNTVVCPECGLTWTSAARMKITMRSDDYADDSKKDTGDC